MKIEEIMSKLQYLTIDKLENPKLELEDLKKISPCLNEDNYLTYIIYLQYRPDLPEDEKECILKLIEALKINEYEQYKTFLSLF